MDFSTYWNYTYELEPELAKEKQEPYHDRPLTYREFAETLSSVLNITALSQESDSQVAELKLLTLVKTLADQFPEFAESVPELKERFKEIEMIVEDGLSNE